jgi:hypothetical protein
MSAHLRELAGADSIKASIELLQLVRDTFFDQVPINSGYKRGRRASSTGAKVDAIDYSLNTFIVANLIPPLLDPCCSIDVAKALRKQLYDLMIERINCSAHVGHRFALFGLNHAEIHTLLVIIHPST